MRSTSTKWKLKDTIIIIICVVIIYLVLKPERDETKEIFNNPEFTIGTVTYYTEGGGIGGVVYWVSTSANIKFEYFVDTVKYVQFYDATTYYIPAKVDVKIGDKYLVIYNNNDAQKSRILLDKPIPDSLTFKSYLKEFEGKKLDPKYHKKKFHEDEGIMTK